MSKKKILIVGGDSRLGVSISKFFRYKKLSYIKTSRRKNIKKNQKFLDLNNTSKFLIPTKVNCALILAYQNNIEQCQKNFKISYKINVTNTVNIIKKLLKNKIFVLFISSNLVFNNKSKIRLEESKKKPSTNYGLMKSLCETKILKYAKKNNLEDKIAILRITKVASRQSEPFKTWKKLIKLKKKIIALKDLYCCPITEDAFNSTVYKIFKNQQQGIFHLSGKKDYSYFQIANKLLKKKGLTKKFIIPKLTSQIDTKIFSSKIKTFLSLGDQSKKIEIQPVKLNKVINNLF